MVDGREGRVVALAPLALALARRGLFDEAISLIPLVRPSGGTGFALEALCEITAMRERWDEAPALVATARDEAEIGEQLSLPLYADRLEGLAAAATGDVERAAEVVRRSAEGFAALEARWEEAWSRLLLAEVVAHTDAARAERELAAALPVFEQLRSVQEVARARRLLGAVAA